MTSIFILKGNVLLEEKGADYQWDILILSGFSIWDNLGFYVELSVTRFGNLMTFLSFRSTIYDIYLYKFLAYATLS